MDSKNTTVVIGAGVVGLATALYLQRSGSQVTVVDPLPPAGGGVVRQRGTDQRRHRTPRRDAWHAAQNPEVAGRPDGPADAATGVPAADAALALALDQGGPHGRRRPPVRRTARAAPRLARLLARVARRGAFRSTHRGGRPGQGLGRRVEGCTPVRARPVPAARHSRAGARPRGPAPDLSGDRE